MSQSNHNKKRSLEDYFERESSDEPMPDSNPKKKRKISTNSNSTKKKAKPAEKWTCHKIWDYDQKGGIYALNELDEAMTFLDTYGFAVISDVIDEKENAEGRNLLLNDVRHINKNKGIQIDNLSTITNKQLPGWSSSGIRLQFGISHGQFAHFCRLRKNIKTIYAKVFGCNQKDLCCSWDSIGVSPLTAKHKKNLWLHADQSMYNEKSEKILGWDYKSIQGALYLTETNQYTVSFIASPESHTKYWDKLAQKTKTKTKHWVMLNQEHEDDAEYTQMKSDIMNDSYRIHVPKNSFLMWNSKVFHQNQDAMESTTDENEASDVMKRILSFICMAPVQLREYKAFENSLVFAINGQTSTHWPQLMKSHASKHPRFTKGNCYENMMDIKPKLNPNLTEAQFQKMIPEKLKDKQVKIYNSEETQSLSLETVHHLGLRDLKMFKVSDLWNLVHPNVRKLQPWMEPK
eukprot:521076_1